MRRRVAEDDPILIVGLGNPGEQYAGTRHNVGAEVAEHLAGSAGLGRAPRRVRARLAQIDIGGRQCIVAVPMTYMNLSGDAVSSLAAYYKVAPAGIVVVHDDMDLPFARIRFHIGRGSGGNNGVDSIIRSLRTPDFWRVRLGVGRPPGRMDPAAYVLRPFAKSESDTVDLMVREAVDIVEAFVTAGDEAAKLAAAEASKRLGGGGE
jgi:peptidyl-tRNA hydrolase, PTH1 family